MHVNFLSENMSKGSCVDKSYLMERYIETSGTIWPVEDDIKLINLIWSQIPKKDTIPFNERLERIEWKNVLINGHTVSESQKRFEKILTKCRTFRLLEELLEEAKQNIKAADLPKKPISSFALFMKENKNMLLKKCRGNGNLFSNFSQVSAKMFRELPNEEKEIYLNRVDEMRKEYKDKISKYNTKFDLSKIQNIKKDEEKNSTFFGFFYKQKKQENLDVNYLDVRKNFHQLDKSQKLEWILKWLEVQPGEKLNLSQYKLGETVLSRNKMNIIHEYEGRPKKMNAYAYFCKEYFAKHKNISGIDLFKKASEEWKSELENKGSYYKMLAQKLRDKYKQEYEIFLNSLPKDRQEYEKQKIIKMAPTKRKRQYNEKNSNETKNNVKICEHKKKKTENSADYKDLRNIRQKEKSKETIVPIEKEVEEIKKLPICENLNEIECIEVTSDDLMQPKQKKIKRKKLYEIKEDEGHSEQTKEKKKKFEKAVNCENLRKIEYNEKSKDDFVQNEQNSGIFIKTSESYKETKHKDMNEKSGKKNRRLDNIDMSESACNKPKQNAPLMKPPSSTYKYYILNIYKGPMNKAKKSYKSLSVSSRNAIRKQYDIFTTNFLQDVKDYTKNLSIHEINDFYTNLKEEGDVVSDITDSDESD